MRFGRRMGYEKVRFAKDYNNVRVTDTVGEREYNFRSKGEHKVAQILELLKRSGHIKDWAYEQTKFCFPDAENPVKTWLIDFDVLENDGSFYYIEYKGLVEADTRRKILLLNQYRPEVKVDLILANKGDMKKVSAKIRSCCRRVISLSEFTKGLV